MTTADVVFESNSNSMALARILLFGIGELLLNTSPLSRSSDAESARISGSVVANSKAWYLPSAVSIPTESGPTTTKDDSDTGSFYTEGDRYVDYGTLYLDILLEEKKAAQFLGVLGNGAVAE